jgi:hypothetical protein
VDPELEDVEDEEDVGTFQSSIIIVMPVLVFTTLSFLSTKSHSIV